MKDHNNLIPEKGKKLHEIYIERFGSKDLQIKRGLEVQSREYQLKLAILVLLKFKLDISNKKKCIVVRVNGCLITHYGNCTKEELIKKYSKQEKKYKL